MRKASMILMNLLLAFFLYCCGEVSTEIDNASYKHVNVDGYYLVERINSEVNRNMYDTDYFYMNGSGVFCYSLKEETTTACVFMDDLQYGIDDFAVWNDCIYYVKKSKNEYELWKCNYETGEETMLLSDDDVTAFYKEKNIIRNIDRDCLRVDVFGDFIYLYLSNKPIYLCPIDGDIFKDSFDINTLFKAEDKSGKIQQVTYNGVVIERYYVSEYDKYKTIGIRDGKGNEILYSIDDIIDVNEQKVRFTKEPGTFNFQYSIDGEEGQHDIEWLHEEKYERSQIEDEHLTVENGKIIGMISVSRHPNIDRNLYQSDIDSDILFDLDIETGESKILYDTKSNQEKIIGYEDGMLYLVRGGKVYSHLLDGDQEKELFDLPAEKKYIIDWQAGYLIIRDKDSSNGKEGDKIISYQISNE